MARCLMLERQKTTGEHSLHSHLVSMGKYHALNWFSRWDFPEAQRGIFFLLPRANLVCLPDTNILASPFSILWAGLANRQQGRAFRDTIQM